MKTTTALLPFLLTACVSTGGDYRPADLLGKETVLDVRPWCTMAMDHFHADPSWFPDGPVPHLYKLTVRCAPGYSFADTEPLGGDLCRSAGPPWVDEVLERLCDPLERDKEAVIVMTADQWLALVEALADRGLAGRALE